MRIALLSGNALFLGGASHDFTSPLGRAAVMSHFRQLYLIFKLRLTWSAATQSSKLANPLHASLRVVFGGSSACNCSVSFRSSSLFAASCSLAVNRGLPLIHLRGLLERAAAPAAPSKILIAAAPMMSHLFFMMSSLRGRVWASLSRPRCEERFEPFLVWYSPNPLR